MPINLKERDGFWHVIGTVTDKDGNRVRIRTSTGFRKHQKVLATDEMNRILHKALNGDLKPNTMSKNKDKSSVGYAVNAFLNRPSKPGKTDQSNGSLLAKSLGEKNFSRLNLLEVVEWSQTPAKKKPLAANAVARRLQTFSAIQSHAKGHGLAYPEFTVVKPVYDDKRTVYLTEDQRDELIEYMPDRIRDMVVVLFYTGMRIGEMLSLQWRQVQTEADGTIVAEVISYKGRLKKRHVRRIPLPKIALDAMGARGTGIVFPTYTGTAWERTNFYSFWHVGCEDAGVKNWIEDGENFHPHDCRHTYASLLVQKGASLKAVQKLLGHSTIAMVMRYAHLSPDALKSTVELLGSVDTSVTRGISFASAKVLLNRRKTGGYDRLAV